MLTRNDRVAVIQRVELMAWLNFRFGLHFLAVRRYLSGNSDVPNIVM